MQNHSLSNRKALALIRPRSNGDRRSLRNLAIYSVIAVCSAVALFYLQRSAQERRGKNWVSATAKIEDARPKLVSQGFSQGGGVMLYQVEVHVRYMQNGKLQEHWLLVAQLPMSRSEAEFKAFRWKANTCTVRWKADDPDKVVAEAS